MRVAFTGHRPHKLRGYSQFDNLDLIEELEKLITHHIEVEGATTFISGMALGVDLWAAEVVARLRDEKYAHIKLVAAIPCLNQESRWPKHSQEYWAKIKDSCDAIVYVSEEQYTAWCLQDRNKWMVDNSDALIAVWDGTSGGTRNCLDYAAGFNKKITYVDRECFMPIPKQPKQSNITIVRESDSARGLINYERD